MKHCRRAACIAVGVLAIGWLAGCGGSAGSTNSGAANTAEMDYGAESEAKSESAAAAEMPAETPAAADMAMTVNDQYREAESALSADSASGAGSGASVAPQQGQTQPAQGNRMLIYTANMTMEVENYGDAYTEVQNLIHLSGGYIVGFTEETTQYEKTGLFTIKVPAGGFNGFLSKLEEIPNLKLNRNLKAQDVSEEYVDLEARLQAKQVVEKRLLGFMEKANRTDDLVTFSNELARVQEEIERMKGRMRYLEQNVAYSTVELRIYEKLKEKSASILGDGPSLSERMGNAVQGSLNVLVTVLEGVLVVVAGAIPVAAAAGIVGMPAYWLWRRRSRKHVEKRSEPERQND
ncbi:DUF4349 domain-containing protein [Paenibacillus alkalitolerans]|uniref:DUF4349 domain-containing protein n=1 Tax=Paenibacillus alkalitolerans TaxID=2799335 RepID=UPI0018F50C65|nr:DUF4349 domain-containing protein [Paenibacillus alkalitolerans]